MEKLILLQSLIPNFDIPSQFFCFVYAADTSGSFSLFLLSFLQWLWSSVGELFCQGLIPSHRHGSSFHFDYIKFFFFLKYLLNHIAGSGNTKGYKVQALKYGLDSRKTEFLQWFSTLVIQLGKIFSIYFFACPGIIKKHNMEC